MVQPIPRPAVAAPGVSLEAPGRRAPERRSSGLQPRTPRAAADLRSLTVLPVAAAGLLVAVAALAPSAVRSAALPLAVCGALLGVPHGAVDHLIPRWTGIPGPRASIALLVPAYLTVALIAGACLVLAPGLTVLSFLLLSALHFGTAESAFTAERRGDATPQPWREPLASCAHGATVVGLLLWARPDDAGPWLRRLSPAAGDAVAAAAGIGLAVTATLIAASFLLAVVRGQLLALAELAVLVGLFTTVPALAAFGVYFGSWHALRHTGRLLDVARAPEDAGWRPAVSRLATASLLPSGAALATVTGLVLARGHAPLLAEVAVLLALTYPHAAVVWSADSWRHGRTGAPPSCSATDAVRTRPG
jgi:Brp/Blh family beta-carotene 15,15'-monooxygenase